MAKLVGQPTAVLAMVLVSASFHRHIHMAFGPKFRAVLPARSSFHTEILSHFKQRVWGVRIQMVFSYDMMVRVRHCVSNEAIQERIAFAQATCESFITQKFDRTFWNVMGPGGFTQCIRPTLPKLFNNRCSSIGFCTVAVLASDQRPLDGSCCLVSRVDVLVVLVLVYFFLLVLCSCSFLFYVLLCLAMSCSQLDVSVSSVFVSRCSVPGCRWHQVYAEVYGWQYPKQELASECFVDLCWWV